MAALGAGLQRIPPKGCRTGKYRGRRAGPEAVRCPIMGKLATVANRIVDRGELCGCPGEGASLSEHVAVLIRPEAPGSRGRQILGKIKISVPETV